MLLRHEAFDERSMFEHGIRAEKRRTFKYLKVSPMRRKDGTVEHGGRDLLVMILPGCSRAETELRSLATNSPSYPDRVQSERGGSGDYHRRGCQSLPWRGNVGPGDRVCL